jgi:hypothetical protein
MNSTATTEIQVECSCTECAKHAAHVGASLPLRASIPTLTASRFLRTKSGAFTKGARHDIVRTAHDQGTIWAAVRSTTNIRPL